MVRDMAVRCVSSPHAPIADRPSPMTWQSKACGQKKQRRSEGGVFAEAPPPVQALLVPRRAHATQRLLRLHQDC